MNSRTLSSGLLAVLGLGSLLFASTRAPGAAAAPRGADDHEFFELRIRPVLADTCFDCHGDGKQKSGLRLDSLAAMKAGGERGPAVVSGHPDESLLLKAVRWELHDLQMPPRKKLDEAVVEDFARWIEDGTPVPDDFLGDAEAATSAVEPFDLEKRLQYWSFQPIRSVDVPGGAEAGHPVDAFVDARLRQAQVEANPRADRETLLRRVTFDLTGLPPTVEELDAFLGDETPGAYERVVDRLLASAAYGEHWARAWLDLMRYAESRGHEFDYDIPNAWRYRDYVVRAFRSDVPYDRFVLEHLAGDLLDEPRPNPDGGWDESILATGSWYLGEEVHSPVDIRGDQVERVANQVDVLSKAFLGLTVACARCHDHKFDPIPTEDYYALAGFALSSSRRQVRYESRETNALVARELERARAAYAPAVRRAVGAAWEASAEDVVAALSVAKRTAAADPADYPPLPAPGPTPPDVLLADFEGEGWGDWTVDGDAFGDGPVRRDAIPSYMGKVETKGERYAHSHVPHQTDDRTGALTSPAFSIERNYLRFFVAGGKDTEQVGVELLLEDGAGGWERTFVAAGANANALVEVVWDVRAWKGRTARLRAYDEGRGGWGNIGLDHVVLSDDEGDPSTREARELARRRELHLVALGEADGLGPDRARAALALVDRARERSWGPLARIDAASPPASETRDETGRVLVDWGAVTGTPRDEHWIVDGPTFGIGPRATGEALLGATARRPLTRVATLPGAYADPAWDGLRLAPESERLRIKRDWVQSGRTVRTATFEVPDEPLWILLEGAADVFAEVDGHRLVQGPLHGVTVKRVGDRGLQWVRLDLAEYAGHRAHLEFTARAKRKANETPFALFGVVAGVDKPALPATDSELLRALSGVGAGQEADAFAVQALRAVGRALANGELDVSGARGADWLAQHAELLPEAAFTTQHGGPSIDEAFTAWGTERERLFAQAMLESNTAPALLDGSAVDEYVLIRGSHRTPGDPAPRRAPVGIGGLEQEPMSRGSGRLELARRLVAADNPFLGRVHVNRVWHHLFGRGLVPTVDNFGVLGEKPTHPELLDWLAGWTAQDGWSTKRLIRLLVTSEAYARRSDPRPDLADVDGANRLWHRTFVRRLSGEAIRDAILRVSGELDATAFGPPVPIHLTDFLQGRGRPGKSGPIDGHGRRSLYLSVRRNFPNAFFTVFDQPKPTTTVGRRSRSNVPAQALSLLNDPFVHEQARAWAERVLAERERDDAADADERAVHTMIRSAFGRTPRPDELELAVAYLGEEAEHRGVDATDLALWTDLAHVLFNAKELCFLR